MRDKAVLIQFNCFRASHTDQHPVNMIFQHNSDLRALFAKDACLLRSSAIASSLSEAALPWSTKMWNSQIIILIMMMYIEHTYVQYCTAHSYVTNNLLGSFCRDLPGSLLAARWRYPRYQLSKRNRISYRILDAYLPDLRRALFSPHPFRTVYRTNSGEHAQFL